MPTLTPITAVLTADILAFRSAMAQANVITQDTMAKISSSTVTANAAYKNLEQSTLKLTAAQEKLATLQASGSASAKEIADAEAAVALAEDKVTVASDRASLAQQNLMRAERAAALAAEEAAAKAEVSSGAFAASAAKGVEGVKRLGEYTAIGAAAVVYETAHMASEFDGAMERLHTQAGVPQSAIKGLSNSVLDLAGQVGFSPENLADSLYHVESAFESMPAALASSGGAMAVAKVAAQGAAVGHSDLVMTTNALTASLAAGLPGVNNASQAMGVLNATVGVGDMKLQDLGGAFGWGDLSNMKIYGATMQDAGAALAVFGDNNKRGAVAGTQLRMSVQAMAVPAATAQESLKKLGMTSDTMAKDMSQHGMLYALTDFHKRLVDSKIPTTEWGDLITKVFGKKAGMGIATLIDQFDRLKSKYPAMNEGATKFGDAWAKTHKTTQQELKEIEASFQSLGVKIGEALIPWLQKAVDWLKQVVDWFGKHKQVAQDLALVVGTVLTAAFLTWGASVLVATWPVLAIIVAIAALVLGAKYLWDHCKLLRDIWHDVSNTFMTETLPALKEAWNSIEKQLGPSVKDLWGAIKDCWPEIKKFGIIILDAVGFVAKLNLTILGDGMKAFASLGGPVMKAAITMIKDEIQVFKDVYDWVTKAAGAIGTFVSQVSGGNLSGAVGTVKSLLGFEEGGYVPGPKGAPQIAVVHGGEYVVSNRMMETNGASGGGALIPRQGGSGGGGGGGTTVVENHFYVDGQQLQPVLQRQVLRYNQRNQSNGLSLQAGR